MRWAEVAVAGRGGRWRCGLEWGAAEAPTVRTRLGHAMPIALTTDRPPADDILDLYDSVGWTAYTRDPDGLARAFDRSNFAVYAYTDNGLTGLARCISDDVSIAYLQDILVRPEAHRQGLGQALMKAVIERYVHVPKIMLLTDNRPQQLAFYSALGFQRIDGEPFNAFLRLPPR